MGDKEKNKNLEFIKKMVDKFPNDQNLGHEIRKYYLTKTQKNK